MSSLQNLKSKKIWILWFQGYENAPELVKTCINSWVRLNPGWDVVILDSNNITDYVSEDLSICASNGAGLSQQSDLLRVLLLEKYGGVWADSTTLCLKSLDDWLFDAEKNGFFAFYNDRKDRIVASWFLYSEKNNYLITELRRKYQKYWEENFFPKPNRLRLSIKHRLEKIFNRNHLSTLSWFSYFITKVIKITPYFSFHYTFNYLYFKNAEFKKKWEDLPRVSSDLPHLAQDLGLYTDVTDEIESILNNTKSPLLKLTWKFDPNRYNSKTVLYWILAKENSFQKTRL